MKPAEQLARAAAAALRQPGSPDAAAFLAAFRRGFPADTDVGIAFGRLEAKPDNETRRASLEDDLESQSAALTGELLRLAGVVLAPGSTGTPGSGPAAGSVDGAVRPLERYLRWLAGEVQEVPLQVMNPKGNDARDGGDSIQLASVYITLNTTTRVAGSPRERTRNREAAGTLDAGSSLLPALGAVARSWHLVLLGDPGAGKSTFTQHLCLCLATLQFDAEAAWLRPHRDGWPAALRDLVPARVVLRRFAAWLATHRPRPGKGPGVTAACVRDFLRQQLADAALESAAAPLEQAIADGRVLVVFDGLDEVADDADRARVREAIEAFATAFKTCRVLVTCRTLVYRGQASAGWQFRGVEGHELAPFTEEQQRALIESWFAALVRQGALSSAAAEGHVRRLGPAIRRRELRELASNPLLLTIMILVHTRLGELPEARVRLYKEAVQFLLWEWDRRREEKEGAGDVAPGLRGLLNAAEIPETEFVKLLCRLAFEFLQPPTAGDESGTSPVRGVLERGRLLEELERLHPRGDLNWAKEVLRLIHRRSSGLLREEEDGRYAFPHRTFQEYLAATHLANQGNFSSEARKLAGRGAYWRVVILLAVSEMVHRGEDERPLFLATELAPANLGSTEADAQAAWLAGDVLREFDRTALRRDGARAGLLNRIQGHLVRLMIEPGLPASLRASLGVTLGHVGDEREGVGCVEVEGRRVPGIQWIEIGAGPFMMGSKKGEGADNERPQFRCELIQRGYRVGKYPVTVEQYGAFVEAGGYRQRRWWTEVGWAWREKRGIEGPEEYWEVYETANHPRVGVSWYEALAYCRWLNGEVGWKRLGLAEGWEVRLPSETEWERAARAMEGRKYPWASGEEPTGKVHANFADSGIRSTSAVGVFVGGGTPDELMDLAGNVWEWGATKWRGDYEDYEAKADNADGSDAGRVLRGGSWFHPAEPLRCAYRLWMGPDGRVSYVGFRLVASPSGA